MTHKDLATALAEKAKAASIPFNAKGEVSYSFALGYLTGTVEQLLLRLSPDQREAIAKLYAIR
jgi:hypothetical protein